MKPSDVIITTALVMLSGKLTKVETKRYQDGTVTELFYDSPKDIIPSDIKWVKSPKPLHPEQIIEHREVQLLNFYHGQK